jgi:hydrogenase maturation protease
VRFLRAQCAAIRQDQLLLIEAGLAPENFSGALRRFDAQVVLLVDAAEMGAPVGGIQILDWRDTAGFGPSTHLQPLSTLAEYLSAEIGCQVVLVGIQPAQLDFERALSAPVRRAVRRVAAAILEQQPMERFSPES